MLTLYRRTVLVIALALVAVTGCTDRDLSGPTAAPVESAALASARKPVHEVFTETFSDEFDCGSFTGLSRGSFTERSATFFDKAGEPLRIQFHIRYRAAIINLTSGKTLPDNANYNGIIDAVTGVVEVNGRIYNVKDRENGIRIKDVGRLVFDADFNITFEAGRHDVGGFGDATPQYCAALA